MTTTISSLSPELEKLEQEYKSACIINGNESIAVASIFTRYGEYYFQTNDLDNAKIYFEKSLSMLESVLKDTHNEEIVDAHYRLSLVIRILSEGTNSRDSKLFETKTRLMRQKLDELIETNTGGVLKNTVISDISQKNVNKVNSLDSTLIYSEMAEEARLLGDYDESKRLYMKTIELRKRKYGSNSPAVAMILVNYSEVLSIEGNYDLAQNNLEQALHIYTKVYGNKHDTVAEVINALGLLLKNKGVLDESESLLLEAIRIRREIYGDFNQYVGATLNNLAELYREKKDFTQSITYHHASIDSFMKSVGANHPGTVNAKGNLGVTLRRQAQWGLHEGESLVKDALEYFQKNNFNQTHPWVVKFGIEQTINQAHKLAKEKKYNQAAELFETILSKKRLSSLQGQVSSSLSAEIMSSKEEMVLVAEGMTQVYLGKGQDHIDKGEYSEANKALSYCINATIPIIGKEHRNVVKLLLYKADTLMELGELELAFTIYLDILQIRTDHHGPDHPLVAEVMVGLGEYYRVIGHYDDAEAFLFQSMHIISEIIKLEPATLKKAVSAYTPLYARILISIAYFCIDKGNYEMLISIMEQLTELCEESFEKLDTIYMQYAKCKAAIFVVIGKLNDATSILQECLDTQRRKFGEDNIVIASIILRLCAVLIGQGNLEGTYKLMTTAMGVIKKYLLLSPTQNETLLSAEAYYVFGLLSYESGVYNEAIDHITKAHEIRERILNSTHSLTLKCRIELAKIQLIRGKFLNANTELSTILNIQYEIMGDENHFDIKYVRFLMAMVVLNQGMILDAHKLFEELWKLQRIFINKYLPSVKFNWEIAQLELILGGLYKTLGRFDDSFSYIAKSGIAFYALSGPNSLKIAECFFHLAELNTARGNYKDSRLLLSRSLVIYCSAVGNEHVMIAKLLLASAENIRLVGYNNDALEAWTLAYSIIEKIYGSDGVFVDIALISKARILIDSPLLIKSKTAEAESILIQVLPSIKNTNGVESIHYFNALLTFAECLRVMGKTELAEGTYSEALKISLQIFGRDNLSQIDILNGLSLIAIDKDELDKASTIIRDQIGSISAKILPKNHPSITYRLGQIGMIKNIKSEGSGDSQIEEVMKAFSSYKQLPFSKDHPWILGMGGYFEDNQPDEIDSSCVLRWADPKLQGIDGNGWGIIPNDHTVSINTDAVVNWGNIWYKTIGQSELQLQEKVKEAERQAKLKEEQLQKKEMERLEREEQQKKLEEDQEMLRTEQHEKDELIAEQERLKAEQEEQEKEQERVRAEQERLKAEQDDQEKEQERVRAEQERLKAEQEEQEKVQERLKAEQERLRAEREEQEKFEKELEQQKEQENLKAEKEPEERFNVEQEHQYKLKVELEQQEILRAEQDEQNMLKAKQNEQEELQVDGEEQERLNAKAADDYNDASAKAETNKSFEVSESAPALTYVSSAVLSQQDSFVQNTNDSTESGALNAATFLFDKAMTLSQNGWYSKAKLLFDEAFSMRKDVLQMKNMLTIHTLFNLGCNLSKMSMWDDAEKVLESCEDYYLDIDKQDSEEMTMTMLILSKTRFMNGKYLKAAESYAQTLKLMLKTFDSFDPRLGLCFCYLGLNLIKVSKIAEGQAQINRGFDILNKIKGSHHIEKFEGTLAKAMSYLIAGKPREAMLFNEQAIIPIRQFLGGETNPSIAECQLQMGITFLEQGKYFEADLKFQSVYQVRKEFFTEDDIKTAEVMFYQAIVMKIMGKFNQALELHKHVLEIRESKISQKVHILLSDSHYCLAEVYMGLGQYGKAKEEIDLSLSMREELLPGIEHSEQLAECYYLQGEVLRRQGHYKEGEALLVQAMESRRLLLGKEHPVFLKSQLSICTVFMNKGDYENSTRLLKRTLKSITNSLGNEHPDYADSLIIYAECLRNSKKNDDLVEAEEKITEALQIRIMAYEKEHYLVAECYNNKALVLLAQKELKEIPIAEIVDKMEDDNVEEPNSEDEFDDFVDDEQDDDNDELPEDEDNDENSLASSVTMEKSLSEVLAMKESQETPNEFERTPDGLPIFPNEVYQLALSLLANAESLNKVFFGVDHPLSINVKGNIGIAKKMEYEANMKFIASLSSVDRKALRDAETNARINMVPSDMASVGSNSTVAFGDGTEDLAPGIFEIEEAINFMKAAEYTPEHVWYRKFEKYHKLKEILPDEMTLIKRVFRKAEYLRRTGDYYSADKLYDETLGCQIEYLKPIAAASNIEVIETLYGKAENLFGLGKIQVSKDTFNQCLASCLKLGGAETLMTCKAKFGLAEIYRAEGLLDEAKAAHEVVLKTRTALVGESHPIVAQSYRAIADCLCEMGLLDEALKLATNSLDMRIAILERDHEDIAEAYICLGKVCASKAAYSLAMEHIEAASQILVKCFGDSHPLLAELLYIRATIKLDQCLLQDAKKAIGQALKMRLKYYGVIVEKPKTPFGMKEVKISSTKIIRDLLNLLKQDEVTVSISKLEYMKDSEITPSVPEDERPKVSNILDSMSTSSEIVEDVDPEPLYVYRKKPVASHHMIAETLYIRAEICRQLGVFKEAKELFTVVNGMKCEVFGVHSIHANFSKLGTALLLVNNGNFSGAEDLMQSMIKTSLRLSSDKYILHENLLLAFANLRRRQWKLDESGVYFSEILMKRKSNYSENHPKTGEALLGVAQLLRMKALYAEAGKKLSHCLHIFRSNFGEIHRLTAEALWEQALCAKDCGDFGTAFALSDQATSTLSMFLGDDHPSTCAFLSGFAEVMRLQGKFLEASKTIEDCFYKQREKLGNHHPDTLASAVLIAWLYTDFAKYSIALKLFEICNPLIRKLFGENHELTAQCIIGYSENMKFLARYDDAEMYHTSACNIRRYLLGDNHPLMAESLCYAGELKLIKCLFTEALDDFDNALAIRRSTLGHANGYVAQAMHGIATCLFHKGRFTESKTMHDRCLSMRILALGADHPDTVQSNFAIALYNRTLGKIEQSASLFERCIEKQRNARGSRHPDVAKSLSCLAEAHNALGHYEKAKNLYLDALEIRKSTYELDPENPDKEHPDLAESYLGIAENLRARGKYELVPGNRKDKEKMEKLKALKERSKSVVQLKSMSRTSLLKSITSKSTDLDNAKSADGNDANTVNSSLGLSNAGRTDRNRKSITPVRINNNNKSNNNTPISGANNVLNSNKNKSKANSNVTVDEFSEKMKLLPMKDIEASMNANTDDDENRDDDLFPSALTLYETSLKIVVGLFGNDHPKTLQVQFGIAETLRLIGCLDAAYHLFEHIHSSRMRLFGGEHLETVDAMRGIADTLRNMSKIYPSKKTEVECAPGKAFMSGGPSLIDHLSSVMGSITSMKKGWTPDTTVSMVHDKRPKTDQNKKRVGIPEFRGGYMGYAFPKKPKNPIKNIIFKLPTKKSPEDAKLLYDTGLSIMSKVFSDSFDHPLTASLTFGKAELMRARRRTDLSLPLLEEALNMRRHIFGDLHPSIAETLNGMAEVLRMENKFNKSFQLFDKALEIYSKVYLEEHPDIAEINNNMAMLHYCQGFFEKAKPLYEASLEMREKLLGKNHHIVAQSLNNFAGLLYAMEDYEDSAPLYLRAIEIKKEVFGESHPDVASAMNNYALLLKAQGKNREAEEKHLAALEIQKNVFGEEHADIAASMSNLSALYASQGRLLEAQTLYRECIQMKRKLFGQHHLSLASTLNNYATFLFQTKSYEESKELYEETLRIRVFNYGNEHPTVADTLGNIALLHMTQEQNNDARLYYEKALAVKQAVYGYDHDSTKQTKEALLYVLQKLGLHTGSKSF